MSLSGKVALITGASSGIGLATAKLFAREGAKVLVTGRNENALKDLVNSIGGENACSVAGDVTNDEDVKHIVSSCKEKFGKLDVLVNNAGVLKGGALDSIDMDNFDFNMSVNARAVMCFTQNAIPLLKEAASASGDASIVNVSSVNGMQSFGGCISYCASKAAVDMMTRCGSVDLAPFGIRVNSVNPGVVVTELQKRGGLDDATYEKFLERSLNVTHPLALAKERLCTPEDIAESILFLSSSKSSFVTGTQLTCDGGRRNAGLR